MDENEREIAEIQRKIQQAEDDFQSEKSRLERQIENARQTLRDFDGFRSEIRAKVTKRDELRDRIAELEDTANGRRNALLEIGRLQDQVDDLTNDISALRRRADARKNALTAQIQDGESELENKTKAHEQYVGALEKELQELSN